MNAVDLLSRGYLPQELPPPFTTKSFATFATSSTSHPGGYLPPASVRPVVTKPAIHSLARAGSLRRRLSIPNPIAYEQLASVVAENWAVLLGHAGGSPISLTTPQPTPGVARAIVPVHNFDSWVRERARVRAGKRFVLKADVSMFYGSIYTHSIPWAIHGKAFAKASRGISHIGNLLDALVRNGQDQQTVGVPIGPDTSLLIAEILLSHIDKLLPSSMADGLRYVDDYEFGCSTQAEAERCLAEIEERLASLELQLNPRKTAIRALPLPLEEFWTPEIRLYRMRRSVVGQATDLLSFFGRVFHLQPSCPDDAILKYAVSRTRSELIHSENWPLYEALLLQAATVEPSTLSIVVSQLVRYARAGFPVGLSRIGDAFNRVIESHGGPVRGSEVAWALWGAIELGCPINPVATGRLSTSDDSIVALLTLDARDRGIITAGLDTTRWEALLNASELRGASWLLAYESFLKGWLASPGGVDFINDDDYFAWLRGGGVSFYETENALPATPLPTLPPTSSAETTAPDDELLHEDVYGA